MYEITHVFLLSLSRVKKDVLGTYLPLFVELLKVELLFTVTKYVIVITSKFIMFMSPKSLESNMSLYKRSHILKLQPIYLGKFQNIYL